MRLYNYLASAATAAARDNKRKMDAGGLRGRGEQKEDKSVIEKLVHGLDWRACIEQVYQKAQQQYGQMEGSSQLTCLVQKIRDRQDNSKMFLSLSDWACYAVHHVAMRRAGDPHGDDVLSLRQIICRLCGLLMQTARAPTSKQYAQIFARRIFFPVPKTKAEIKAAERAAAYKAETERLALAWGSGGTANIKNK
jgi:hypothetical protein